MKSKILQLFQSKDKADHELGLLLAESNDVDLSDFFHDLREKYICDQKWKWALFSSNGDTFTVNYSPSHLDLLQFNQYYISFNHLLVNDLFG